MSNVWEEKAEREEQALHLLKRADEHDLWIWPYRGVICMYGRPKYMTKKLKAKIRELKHEIWPLIQDRREDGRLDQRLVVFLEDVKASVFQDDDQMYEYELGDYEVLDSELAGYLVKTGTCAFHPGPKE